jgi:putative transposase
VRPDTFVRWHREGFRLFWRWKSRRRGRPRIPVELQQLIADMASANRTWGEERIAAELRLKLGLTVSPRTVRRYMPRRPTLGGNRQRAQSWATFLRNHAGAVLACDFFVVVTAAFQRVYVFVIVDIATRRIVHWNLTPAPTAAWTIQQFRNGLPIDGASRLLVHDRDGIFTPAVDDALASMSLRALKTPVRTPQANAHCERFIGSARRACLDWIFRSTNAICGGSWRSGSHTSTGNAHIPRWVQDCRTNRAAGRRCPGTASHTRIASSPALGSVACTTITASKASPREFLRSTGVH